MIKLFFLIIFFFAGYCLYAEYQSGYCGFGMFNKMPSGINVYYVNSYSINDSDGWGIIYNDYEGVLESEETFMVNRITKLSYTENAVYALVKTNDEQELYAIIDQPKPINNQVQYVTKENFANLVSPQVNWIETSSTYCKAGTFMNYAAYYFYALIAMLSLMIGIKWLVSKER